jgi:hypothetical protein
MHDAFEPDPLDRLLAPPPLPAGAADLRQDLLGRTSRVLRRRRRLRTLAWAAALAACYGAGLWTVRRLAAPAPRPGAPEVARQPDAPPPPPAPAAPPSALAVEWRACDEGDRQATLYREAGDRYLDEENDPRSALRCYGNALDAGTEQDLAIAPSDSWLLMAIKDARQKEKRHAQTGG